MLTLCSLDCSVDVLQMADSGIWGNPLGFEEEAMQVQSIQSDMHHVITMKQPTEN